MSPLAIDGAAPMMTTKRIADSLCLNRISASGNHEIDGIVCNPVIIEPTAVRRTRTRDTAIPINAPTTMARLNPTAARRNVTPIARHVTPLPSSSPSRGNTVSGPGSV